MEKLTDFRKAAVGLALDQFLVAAGDTSSAVNDDFIIDALKLFGIPFREDASIVSWQTGGRSVAGIKRLAHDIRQGGMPGWRRLYLVGKDGVIPTSGSGCPVLDFSADGQTVNFSARRNAEPVAASLGEVIDAAVELCQRRYGDEVPA
ncbi:MULTISPECIES: hypothetical protein [Aeromonas]|uniref:hypothetical protein n=1 Tax=Aeromonas TaxID=642 RepID=UPI000375C564|nr:MULTISPECIES: hypothetical protein [Aeromonas]QXC36171.1 hypothetical protein I6L37_11235 [Aeromonas sp. FDAARGOS 1407]TNI44088.1 hypothetical protein CF130_11795 [Aeromonas dhakensis]